MEGGALKGWVDEGGMQGRSLVEGARVLEVNPLEEEEAEREGEGFEIVAAGVCAGFEKGRGAAIGAGRADLDAFEFAVGAEEEDATA